MRKAISIIVLLSTAGIISYSQNGDTTFRTFSTKELCLHVGFNAGIHTPTFLDLGVSVNKFGVVGDHPFNTAYFMSGEFHFGDTLIVAPKIGIWFSGGVGGLALGFNLLAYTDFHKTLPILRTEIGLGFIPRLKIAYGYNGKLTNISFDEVPKHLFVLTYCFKLKQLMVKQGGR